MKSTKYVITGLVLTIEKYTIHKFDGQLNVAIIVTVIVVITVLHMLTWPFHKEDFRQK